jgi:hypothetical protein
VRRAACLAAWRLAPWPRIFDSATATPPPAPHCQRGEEDFGGAAVRAAGDDCRSRTAAGGDGERPLRSESASCEPGLRRYGRRRRQAASRQWRRRTAWCREVCGVKSK